MVWLDLFLAIKIFNIFIVLHYMESDPDPIYHRKLVGFRPDK
jgi:hypothetical protein